jgi:hypothetical protein
MQVLAIDPGTENSAWCLYDGEQVIDSAIQENSEVLGVVENERAPTAIEMIASYGMPVGVETFETVLWIGQFTYAHHACHGTLVDLVYRKDVALHLCHSARAKDTNVRRALLDRFSRTGGGDTPQVGIKKQPGPLYGVRTHIWSALAVAVYWWDTQRGQQ